MLSIFTKLIPYKWIIIAVIILGLVISLITVSVLYSERGETIKALKKTVELKEEQVINITKEHSKELEDSIKSCNSSIQELNTLLDNKNKEITILQDSISLSNDKYNEIINEIIENENKDYDNETTNNETLNNLRNFNIIN